jgi:perosamine synthetase|tara:strand:- start:2902 stop:4119 length:1218 start_codon:yes stop_codon:yes gene_type:complete
MNKISWRFKNNELRYIKKLLDSDLSLDVSMNERLEKLFARIHKQKFAITSNSGTSTLHQALYAAGVGHGDEVIIPSLTVAMCGFVIWQCGATPVYADVNEDTFLIDPKDVKKKITKKTKAIIAVNLYGLMCDLSKLKQISRENKLVLIEDCAQCFLGMDNKNRIAGTVGDIGSWSFEKSKHVSTGEGGILTTNNKKFAVKIRKFGSLGFKTLSASTGMAKINKSKYQDPKWLRHDRFSYNYRMSEFLAAIGLAQVEKISYFVKLRMSSGKKYHEFFSNLKNNFFKIQKIPRGYKHGYFTYPVIYNGDKFGISWKRFRKSFIKNGGDGIYAAWQTVNNEIPFKLAQKKGLFSGSMKLSDSYGWGNTPIAEKIQKKIMQFTTNQKNNFEVNLQIKALKKSLKDFGIK